jgi:tetratricopeptide (TPR) repeat protein/transcriptional regulator with XRE-family HTH domain
MMEESKEDSPGARLRAERIRREWTRRQLATQLGVDESTIKRWERNSSVPIDYNAVRLRTVFGEHVFARLGFSEKRIKKDPKPVSTGVTEGKDREHEEKLPEGSENDSDERAFRSQAGSEIDLVPSEQISLTVPQQQSETSTPRPRNPFFTGRDSFLDEIHTKLIELRNEISILPLSISGLGGVGKTQTAIEYASRHRNEYQMILWIQADSHVALTQEFERIVRVLNPIESEVPAGEQAIDTVKQWLRTHTAWLLVYDNVENLEMLRAFLPTEGRGDILLTTRDPEAGAIAQTLELTPLTREEGALLVLRRAKLIALHASIDEAGEEDLKAALELSHLLGGLPLALDQAGGYIEGTPSTLARYLELYQAEHERLLKERSTRSYPYPASVATTWAISFQKIRQTNSVAAQILYLLAFLDPEAISLPMIWYGRYGFSLRLRFALNNPVTLDIAIRELHRFSLVQYDSQNKVIAIHRLMQTVLRDDLGKRKQRYWARRAIKVVNRAFTAGVYIPQARTCATLITQRGLVSREAADLLFQAGKEARSRQLYRSSEAFLSQALSLYEQIPRPRSLDLVECLKEIALVYQDQQNFEQAQRGFERALALSKKAFGPKSPNVSVVLNHLADFYWAQGNYTLAESLFQQALTIQQQQRKPDYRSIVVIFRRLESLYSEQKRFEEAEQLIRQELDLLQGILEPESLGIAVVDKRLADMCILQEKYEEAETLVQQALIIYKHHLKEEKGASFATCFESLAVISFGQEQYEQAESLYQRAVAAMEGTHEVKSPYMVRLLDNYALFLLHRGKEKEATQQYTRATNILKEISSSSEFMEGLVRYLHEH